MLQEVDIEVIRALCDPFPEDHGFVLRLRQNQKALFLSHWKDHFEWLFAASIFPKGSTILDWGCGTGHSDVLLAAHGYKVVGADIDELGITIANYVRSLQSPTIQSLVSFHLEAPKLDYSAAWSSHVLEHVPKAEWRDFFSKIYEAGASSVLLSVPLGRAYFDPDHKNFWDSEIALSEDLGHHGKVEVNWVRCDKSNEVLRAMLTLRAENSGL